VRHRLKQLQPQHERRVWMSAGHGFWHAPTMPLLASEMLCDFCAISRTKFIRQARRLLFERRRRANYGRCLSPR
jgi:hypothetical protein